MIDLTFALLRDANEKRQQEWDAGNAITLEYRGNELAGEVGEACNVVKKLARERLGIRGSRATAAQLAEELADVIICADLIAMHAGINLGAAVARKFNATSEKNGLHVFLTRRESMSFVETTDNSQGICKPEHVCEKCGSAGDCEPSCDGKMVPAASDNPQRSGQPAPCTNDTPPTFSGHWREWHRGHGCEKDPDSQTDEAKRFRQPEQSVCPNSPYDGGPHRCVYCDAEVTP